MRLTLIGIIILIGLTLSSLLSAEEAKPRPPQAEGYQNLTEEILNHPDLNLISDTNLVVYRVLKKSAQPKRNVVASDSVSVSYTGYFLDGTIFDESKAPVTLGVSEVIEGWTLALLDMPVGATWRIYLTPDLAYGKDGRGPIPPNATLIFDVTLHGVVEE